MRSPAHTGVTGLEIHDLVVAYGSLLALDGVDLRAPAGALTAVIGPNGAGKSTLLRAILGLVPSRGTIRVGGESGPPSRRRIAWVPQRSAIDWSFPASAADVVGMVLPARRGVASRLSREDRTLVTGALERVDAAHLADRPIGELSGGQAQRVVLARALVQDADVLLCDEPLAGLDAATSDVVAGILRAEAVAGRCVVVVEHDLDAVRQIADSVALLDGRVIAHGPADQVLTTDNLLRTFRAGRAA